MGVAQLTAAAPAPAPAEAFPEQRLLLYAVNWQSYQRFLEAVGTRRIRLTYDRGRLEIMTLSGIHEWWRRRIGFVLLLLGGALRIDVQGYGSTTLRSEDAERGLEPDEGFYIGATSYMRGPRDIDLSRDPPPDLAIEIDISRSSLDRMAIYAALRIQEVWRFDGEFLHVFRLRADGAYEPCGQSLCFSMLPLAEFVQFLRETEQLSETALIEPLRAWTREHVLSRLRDTGNGV